MPFAFPHLDDLDQAARARGARLELTTQPHLGRTLARDGQLIQRRDLHLLRAVLPDGTFADVPVAEAGGIDRAAVVLLGALEQFPIRETE
jgi:hypothetical protein